jgi:uncharacterized lipoprotein YehR (DUF1307 family)
MKTIVLCMALVALAGCSSTNIAELAKALSGDNATVCNKLTTVYGSDTFLRSNVQNGKVSCDGLTIDNTQAGVILGTVVPSGTQAAPVPVQIIQPSAPLAVPK